MRRSACGQTARDGADIVRHALVEYLDKHHIPASED